MTSNLHNLPIEAAKRILADPKATEYKKSAAREVLEDFVSGKLDHPFSEFLIDRDYGEV